MSDRKYNDTEPDRLGHMPKPTEQPTVKPCPDCDGKQVSSVMGEIYSICQTCNGTGQQPAEQDKVKVWHIAEGAVVLLDDYEALERYKQAYEMMDMWFGDEMTRNQVDIIRTVLDE